MFALSNYDGILENTIAGGATTGDIGLRFDITTSMNNAAQNVITGVDTSILDQGTGNIINP